MKNLRRFCVWYVRRRHVRPWGLAASVLVLLVALPLLRPLRYPDPTQVADDELVRLATVQAIVEQRTLAIDRIVPRSTQGTVVRDGHRYSTQPPMLAAILSAPYRAMYGMGLSLSANAALVPYLLTVIAVTLPVALAAGILYRMGRLFELSRPWRMVLAMGVIFCGGLISYATVLNAHAPAATLILGAAACLLHLVTVKNPMHSGGWLALAGFCAALGSTIEPTASIFFLLLIAVVFAFRWSISLRLGGALLYLLGAAPPLLLHAVLTIPAYGTALPTAMLLPSAPRDPSGAVIVSINQESQLPAPELFAETVHQPAPDSIWVELGRSLGRLWGALLGTHGLFSHFPVLILALLGAGAVMHRHWPRSTKMLAGVTLTGAGVVVLLAAFGRADWSSAMFASRWFIVFLPLLLFWAGAWLRRSHRRVSWALASAAVAFSLAVSVVGAANPYPRGGFHSYTAAAAWRTLIGSDRAPAPALPANLPVASTAS